MESKKINWWWIALKLLNYLTNILFKKKNEERSKDAEEK